MLTENRSVVIVVFLHGNQLIFICTYILFLYIMHIYNKRFLSFIFIVWPNLSGWKQFFQVLYCHFVPTKTVCCVWNTMYDPFCPHDNIIEWRIILKCSAISSLLVRYTFYITLIQKCTHTHWTVNMNTTV